MRRTVLLLASVVTALLLASGVAWAVTKDCRAGADYCIGTDREGDTLNGSEERDKIYGLAENDKLFGNGGNDSLRGGRGDDLVRGGAGEDWFSWSDAGRDGQYGGDGDDELVDYSYDSDGNDRNVLNGGAGNDGVQGHSVLRGAPGNDDIFGMYVEGGGVRTINSGSGQDEIGSDGPVNDTIYAEDGERDVIKCGGEKIPSTSTWVLTRLTGYPARTASASRGVYSPNTRLAPAQQPSAVPSSALRLSRLGQRYPPSMISCGGRSPSFSTIGRASSSATVSCA